MENAGQIHGKYAELEIDVQFYKQEINFLLKIIVKEYTISMTRQEIVKLLDSCWTALEQYLIKLTELEYKIKKRKDETSFLCKHEINSISLPMVDDKRIFEEYLTITNALKEVKRGLYSYMESEPRRKLSRSLL